MRGFEYCTQGVKLIHECSISFHDFRNNMFAYKNTMPRDRAHLRREGGARRGKKGTRVTHVNSESNTSIQDPILHISISTKKAQSL